MFMTKSCSDSLVWIGCLSIGLRFSILKSVYVLCLSREGMSIGRKLYSRVYSYNFWDEGKKVTNKGMRCLLGS